ncbi:MAG TPA: RNA polymerase sigma factor [Blastocatellia bacterium]|jgi:RNA polymerase sigma-70 factor (ECF subfamily)|nr:RNA polymerase sigma factor [Blastocatellia bacterium]
MMMTPSFSDEELLRLIIAGDEDAFATLYGRRQGGVYRFALHMSGSESIADDVTQEVFIVLMREAASYDSTKGSLSAYLYGIARNHVLRCLRRDRLYVPIAGESNDQEEPVPEQLIADNDPLGDLTRSEAIESVRQAVLALPPHYREVVALCDLQEMSYVDAANALGCAVGTVRSRLHRARGLLTERLRASSVKKTAVNDMKPVRCFT